MISVDTDNSLRALHVRSRAVTTWRNTRQQHGLAFLGCDGTRRRGFVPTDAGLDLAEVAEQEIRVAFDKWLRRIAFFAAVVALISALAWADSLAVIMGGSWWHAVDLETLSAVLFDTAFGHVWVLRLALATALVALLPYLSAPWSRPQQILVASLSVALVATIAGVTHAAMHTGASGRFHQLAHGVHLICAAFLIGGLAMLGYVLAPARRDHQWIAFARRALVRYSRLGIVAVWLLLLTGIINTIFLVSPASLVRTAYGWVLIAKICLFLCMVTLALINRRLLLPNLLASSGANEQNSAAALWRVVGAEQALGFLIVILVSILGMLPPPH